jgi:hypothetical protein
VDSYARLCLRTARGSGGADTEGLADAGDIPGAGTAAFRYYIDVEDVDRLYAELKSKIDALWKGQVHGPVNQEYGQREFMVVAPDGT